MAIKLCECGCGEPAPIAKKTNAAVGKVKGQPQRFVMGHAARVRDYGPDYAVDPDTGCWVWLKNRDRDGYGLCAHRVPRTAHRWYWVQRNGPVPDGLELDHLCRNRLCVNPEHLEAVTHGENQRRAPFTKLDWEKVRAIRESSEPQKVLAERYGCSAVNISLIKNGKAWVDRGASSDSAEVA